MEATLEVPIDLALQIRDEVRHIVENVVTLAIPLKVDIKICSDWSQMKDDDFHGLDMANYTEELHIDSLSDTAIGYGLAEFSALFF